ncbi:SCO family protein [Halorientalis salina]|uniref:SCO family protein n=1 Tax=Halorientalis salina TaxID=2932266 RepID=UPI0010ABAB9D|nr:SCO family protein [Halorientalis salina]
MTDRRVSRRSLLGAAGSASVAGLAGCTDLLGSGSGDGGGNTYLDAKDWGGNASALPFPTHGDELPSAEVPLALGEETRAVPADYAGQDVVMTFVYTHCNTMCPRLTAILAGVQAHAIDNDYAERVAFAEITFDPARDDAERFREYADDHDVALDTGTWEFLRPESEQRAKAVVQDTYGVAFEKTTPEEMDMYMFAHSGVVVLANKQGYVERAYKLSSGASGTAESGDDDFVSWQTVEEDLATLRDRED